MRAPFLLLFIATRFNDEKMQRTFGERRARARGEVSHDLISFLLCVFVCVCARGLAF